MMKDVTPSKIVPFEHISKLTPPHLANGQPEHPWHTSNQNDRPNPCGKCIHELFETQARLTPTAEAVRMGDDRLTYRQLNTRANQLAHHLQTLGAVPDALIGLCVSRSIEMIIGLLAIAKAGATYVPLDPEYPKQRIAQMIDESAMQLLLTERQVASKLPHNTVKRVELDEFPWHGDDPGNPKSNVGPESLAYVIYTSGSTGKPKGVEIPHRALVNCIWHFRESLGVNQNDSWLAITTLSFDIAGLEIWLPLLSGARCVVASRETAMDGKLLQEAITTSGATILQATPATWKMLLLGGWPGGPKMQLLCGGEAMPQDLADRLVTRGRCAWNVYGPTETTIWSTAKKLYPGETVSIGRPISNTYLYILDADLKPVSLTEEGDLYIGGDGIARGYRNRPDLTSEKFIPNPFLPNPGARIYQTGDRAKWLADGSVSLLGRTDSQVKLRGFRIELGEIETALRALPTIQDAVASIRESSDGNQELVAFLVTDPTSHLTFTELTQSLRRTLPSYMIPARFFTVPDLPLTPNGKLDRKSLDSVNGEELIHQTSYVPPTSEIETLLTEIWQSALGRNEIGIHDHFFQLGGHSLIAVSICSQVTRRCGITVPLRWVFEHPSIASLAKKISLTPGHDFLAIQKADRSKPLPMSLGQQGLWLQHQVISQVSAYNESLLFQIQGAVDKPQLQASLQQVLERHEILRTALVQDQGVLVQRIWPASEIELPWRERNIEVLPPTDRLASADKYQLDEARHAFDLSTAPLWRALWIRLGPDQFRLILTFHHSIIDEWTHRNFILELGEIYSARTSGKSLDLAQPEYQYADFSSHQNSTLNGLTKERQLSYWKTELADLSNPIELPLDKPKPSWPSGEGAIHDFEIDSSIISRLREIALNADTTLFTAFLTAYQIWLHRYSGQHDILVATPVALRSRPEFQSMLGYFLNTLPIRTRLSTDDSFITVLTRVRETLLGAYSHPDVPSEELVEMMVKEHGISQPLNQLMFVLLEQGLPGLKLGEVTAQPELIPNETAKAQLILSVDTSSGRCLCRFEYSTDLFLPETIARMSIHLSEILRSVVDEPRHPIGRLRMMPADEQSLVVTGWNQTERIYPRDGSIHELFEKQASRCPHAIALASDDGEMTYAELSRRSDHVARHLRSLGVGHGDLVGLSIKRSFNRIVALLAILKAGGIYWALEENLPKGRLKLLVVDARPRLILADNQSLAELSKLAPAAAIEDLLVSQPLREIGAIDSITAKDPAYVSYTSGSTGKPNGVIIPHRGVLRLVLGVDYVSLNEGETLIHLSPLSFDASTFEIWGALLNGGRVVIPPQGQLSLAEIGTAIERHGVTTLWLTAGLFHLMVDEQLEQLKTLRQLLAGGDVLCPIRVAKAREALPECRIINGYGPTENTTFTCCYPIEVTRDSGMSVPIGRPISNTRVYILDAELQPVPVGIPGEIYTGGDGVACGYLNQPQRTAERFLPDLFQPDSSSRLYRTGDRARWLADGNIEFLGRLDSQVKIRGYRVELSEIDNTLRAHSSIKDAVTVLHQESANNISLTAYVIPADGAELSNESVIKHARSRLPDYMIPTTLVPLREIPLLPNGKLDRNKLPLPKAAFSKISTSEPKDLLELELIKIWRRLFHRNDIDRSDHFFELGGHSLLAAKLAAEIDKLLNVKLPIAALFQSPTIESLARRLTEKEWLPAWSSLVPLQTQGEKPPLFLVHGWGGDVYCFLDLAKLMAPDQPVYGIQAAGLDGHGERPTTATSMAAHYVREILSFQPKGPYQIGGYSLGGLIAFEMASQLHRLGHRVSLLALFDSCPIGTISWKTWAYSRSRLLYHLSSLWKEPCSYWPEYLRYQITALFGRMALHRAEILPLDAADKPVEYDHYHILTCAHRLESYPGTAAVFCCDDSDSHGVAAWRYLALGGVSYYRVPGTHYEIIAPANVAELAKSVRKAISDSAET